MYEIKMTLTHLDYQPDPVIKETEYLRKLLKIAIKYGWEPQQQLIVKVIDRVTETTF